MKDPAFLFYSSDFLSGISDLTMDERGQYITLLCLQHQKGNLSPKTISLSVGSVSVDVLKKFEKDSEGNFFNERLSEEIEKRNKFTYSRRLNGLQGGRGKKKKPNAKAKEKHMHNLMGNENENRNEVINRSEEKFDFKNELLKYGFQENLIEEWLKIRKTKKAVNTETALKGFLSELETRSCDPNLILKTIIERSWSGFKWSWIDNLETSVNGKTKNGNSNGEQAHISPLRSTARQILQGSESKDNNGGS